MINKVALTDPSPPFVRDADIKEKVEHEENAYQEEHIALKSDAAWSEYPYPFELLRRCHTEHYWPTGLALIYTYSTCKFLRCCDLRIRLIFLLFWQTSSIRWAKRPILVNNDRQASLSLWYACVE
jgi:hypothetical protein